MNIANIVNESLHIFWTTCGISMEFSGKMWLMIILKVTKNQEFTISLADTFSRKTTGEVKLSTSLFSIKNISMSLWLISKKKRAAWWLATCARKPQVPVRARLPAMCRGELSAVIARLISKCLWSGWKW